MRTGKRITVVLASGLLLTVSSCATDFGYYLLNALIEYLPEFLEALTTTTTTTTT